ncbi:MAG: hypothetical protein H6555_10660 [Lewinellaceae bacterium]|nr:hypothetical protein [Lewinellaceae bacterium]
MSKLSFLICLGIFFVGSNGTAQDLHVYYNMEADSLTYVRGGKKIESPTVRRGDQVFLHVTHYNNYLYDVSVKTAGTEVSAPASFNPLDFTSIMGGGASGATDMISAIFGGGRGLPPLMAESVDQPSGDFGFASASQKSVLDAMGKRFRSAQNLLVNLESDMAMKEDEIKKSLEGQRIRNLVAAEVQKLKYNPNLKTDQIKRISQEYMERIFEKPAGADLTITEVLASVDAEKTIASKADAYGRDIDRYGQTVAQITGIRDSLRTVFFNVQEAAAFLSQVGPVNSSARQRFSAYQDKFQELQEVLPEVHDLPLEDLINLRYTYEELQSNNFTYVYRHTADSDKLTFTITLNPVDSLKTQGIKSRTLAPVEIKSYGGLRINTSVGLSFAQFFKRPQEFFIRDGIVLADNKDQFFPMVTTFAHFYGQAQKGVSVGGSFGVGIPLGSGGNNSSLQSVAFYMGPSFVFGRDQRVVFSTGLMGGKVDKLSEGYKVGDAYLSSTGEPTVKGVYELGYFLGISFNLLPTGK